ncbi:class I SAM-dependent methyltransferase [Streptomyces sp. YU58]|uniref:class I SAM-dependent methyltransferase n=1 Tax=Streptomyces sp. SX92 TaxID=3158972 RepID=UPI0027BAC720|nr:class I SAM-dependent methyltransferase [Streptomyces coralus]WLW51277.1 class I SAM-dependent methyltransferase [Streptomyces coralus]
MSRAALTGWEDRFAAGLGFRRVDSTETTLLTTAVPARPGARALDVGCGLGTYAAALAGLGYDTLAVDWADAAVAATRDRYADLEPRLRARRLDFDDGAEVERLPRAAFDLVTMRLVLAFMTDKRATAERVRRLLTPGGVWVVTTPLTGRLPEERRRIGLTPEEVAVVTEGWAEGAWYDLEPNGVRCFVLRAGSGH